MAGQKREPTTRLTAANVFVGRERELEIIADSFHAARSGSLRVVLVVGEPGIGKTRLVREASALCEAAGATVLWGRCHEEPGAPPFWPWIQALRSLVDSSSDQDLQADLGDGASDIANLIPSVRLRLQNEASGPTLSDPEFARFRFFDSIVGFLRRASERRPIVLAFDNLHWSDRPSLLLLGFVSEHLTSSRLLVIGTYRPDALHRGHPLPATLADLTRNASPVRIRLGGLRNHETREFVRLATGSPPAQWLADGVHAHTEGNPLFLGEVVRWLQETQVLEQLPKDSDRFFLGIPDGVREVIGKRLEALDPRCVEAFRIASVVGREFELDLLTRLPACPPSADLARYLEDGVRARILEELGPGRYQFTHALIRETLYDELSLLRRQELHLSIAQAVKASQDPQLAALPRLAHHFARAADISDPEAAREAIEYCVLAADRAMRLLAYEEAVRNLEDALHLIRLVHDDARRIRLLTDLGYAHHRAGSASGALESFQKAAELAKRLGDRVALAEAAIGFEEASWRPGLPGGPAARLLETALDAVGTSGKEALRARLLAALGRALVYTGATERAKDMSEEAARLARLSGDDRGYCAAKLVLLNLVWLPELLPARIAAAQEMADRAAAIGDLVLERDAIGSLMCCMLEVGDPEGLRKAWERHTRVHEQLRQPFHASVQLLAESSMALAEGRFADAERTVTESSKLGRRLRGYDFFGAQSVHMFTLRREQGALVKLEPVIRKIVASMPANGIFKPGLALVYADLQDATNARLLFDELMANDLRDVARDSVWPGHLAYLAEVCHFLGDRRGAQVLHQHLQPFASYNLVIGGISAFLGPAARLLALLDEVLDQLDEAEEHLRYAIEMGERMGAQPWLAHGRYEYGRLLLMRPPARHVEARSLIASARSMAERLGMGGLLQQMDREAKQAGAPTSFVAPVAPRKESLVEPLSERELDVLRLIALGRSNQEIARELVISVNTAANHVKNILGKTGAANRTEAAAFAFRNGLVTRTG